MHFIHSLLQRVLLATPNPRHSPKCGDTAQRRSQNSQSVSSGGIRQAIETMRREIKGSLILTVSRLGKGLFPNWGTRKLRPKSE